MKGCKNQLYLFILLLLFPFISYASIRPIVTVMGGSDSPRFQTTQNITLMAPYQDTFTGSNTDATAIGGIFLGAESTLYRNFLWQLGLSYYQTSAFTANGTIWQFTDPNFNNIGYKESIRSKRVLIEGKILSTLKTFIHPYVTLGAGESFNTAYSYSESALQPYAVTHPEPFENHTSFNFAYMVGIGVDLDVNEHIRVGATYHYVSLGDAKLGLMPDEESDDRLTYSNLSANEVLLSVSFLG